MGAMRHGGAWAHITGSESKEGGGAWRGVEGRGGLCQLCWLSACIGPPQCLAPRLSPEAVPPLLNQVGGSCRAPAPLHCQGLSVAWKHQAD